MMDLKPHNRAVLAMWRELINSLRTDERDKWRADGRIVHEHLKRFIDDRPTGHRPAPALPRLRGVGDGGAAGPAGPSSGIQRSADDHGPDGREAPAMTRLRPPTRLREPRGRCLPASRRRAGLGCRAAPRPGLPEAVRAGIVAMVKAASGGKD
jgi:hypothetical protein